MQITGVDLGQKISERVNTSLEKMPVEEEKKNTLDSIQSDEIGATLELSKEGQKKSLEDLQEQLQSAQDAGDGMKDTAKLMLIARRIANGDIVPPSDERKLMEYNNELYMSAKAAAAMRKNHKPRVYDSVFDEDENESQSQRIRDLEREMKGEQEIEDISSGSQMEESTNADTGGDY